MLSSQGDPSSAQASIGMNSSPGTLSGTMEIHMLLIDLRGPADGKLAQQTPLHLGVAIGARHAVGKKLEQRGVDPPPAAFSPPPRWRSGRPGPARAATAPASAATASARPA